MKKFFLSAIILLGFLSCETEENSKQHYPQLEISFAESKYKLQLGVTNQIEFTVSGIEDADVEVEATLKNKAWSSSVHLDQNTGKGVLSVMTPEKLGVTTAKVVVRDVKNDRTATASIALASTAEGMDDILVYFTGESYTVNAAGDPIELGFRVEKLGPAVLETPVESDVVTPLNVVGISYDAVSATGTVTVSAPESAGDGTVSVVLKVRDDFMREASCSTPVEVIGVPDKPVSYNCYIVKPGGTLVFDSKYSTITNVEIEWQDAPALIKSVSIDGSEISVVTNAGTPGNALVLGKNDNGDILWSWHVWVCDFDPEATAVTINGFTFMDRNLGAVSATVGDIGAIGQAYQFGRKDPLPRPFSKVSSGTAEYQLFKADGSPITVVVDSKYYKIWPSSGTIDQATATAHPDYFIERNAATFAWWAGIDADAAKDFWGGETGVKSEYDPCPQGWKVPVITKDADGNDVNPYQFVKESSAVVDSDNMGLLYTAADGSKLWLPSTGERPRTTGLASRTAIEGNYWLGSFFKTEVSGSNTREHYRLMQFSSAKPDQRCLDGPELRALYPSVGIGVRCVKE